MYKELKKLNKGKPARPRKLGKATTRRSPDRHFEGWATRPR